MTNSTSGEELYSLSAPADHVHTFGKSKERPRMVFLYRVEEPHLSSDHTVCHFSDIKL